MPSGHLWCSVPKVWATHHGLQRPEAAVGGSVGQGGCQGLEYGHISVSDFRTSEAPKHSAPLKIVGDSRKFHTCAPQIAPGLQKTNLRELTAPLLPRSAHPGRPAATQSKARAAGVAGWLGVMSREATRHPVESYWQFQSSQSAQYLTGTHHS